MGYAIAGLAVAAGILIYLMFFRAPATPVRKPKKVYFRRRPGTANDAGDHEA